MSRLVRVMCPSVCLDLADLGPAMLFSGAMAEGCFTLVLVTRCPTVGRAFNFEIEYGEGYMGFVPPGGKIDVYTPEGYANATLVIPQDDFHSALKHHFPEMPQEPLRHGAGVKVSVQAMSALTDVLETVEGALIDPALPLERLEVREKLEERLLKAFMDGLKSGLQQDTPRFGSRTTSRVNHLRLAREFVAKNANRAFSLGDLSQAIGMSPRGVELLFRESLGISPGTFIKNRRLHGVRRMLLNSDRKAGLVKESAMEWGFSHMGHFSRNYRQLFGESPSETVGR